MCAAFQSQPYWLLQAETVAHYFPLVSLSCDHKVLLEWPWNLLLEFHKSTNKNQECQLTAYSHIKNRLGVQRSESVLCRRKSFKKLLYQVFAYSSISIPHQDSRVQIVPWHQMAPFVDTLIVQLRELLGSVAGQVNLCLYILFHNVEYKNKTRRITFSLAVKLHIQHTCSF